MRLFILGFYTPMLFSFLILISFEVFGGQYCPKGCQTCLFGLSHFFYGFLGFHPSSRVHYNVDSEVFKNNHFFRFLPFKASKKGLFFNILIWRIARGQHSKLINGSMKLLARGICPKGCETMVSKSSSF